MGLLSLVQWAVSQRVESEVNICSLGNTVVMDQSPLEPSRPVT